MSVTRLVEILKFVFIDSDASYRPCRAARSRCCCVRCSETKVPPSVAGWSHKALPSSTLQFCPLLQQSGVATANSLSRR